MNLRVLQPVIILCFLIASAFIAADILNIYGRGAMTILPSFRVPKKSKKPISAEAPVEEYGEKDIAYSSSALPSIKLLGTITGAFPYAVVLDITANRQELYRLKSDVGDGWIVSGIEKNKISLKKGDRKEVLEVKFMETEPKTEAGAGLKPPTGAGLILDQRDVEGALADLNKVMTQARVVPNLVEGKTTGYRIFNIVPGSIYIKLGLKNNDIIERVNGVEIQNPESLYQLFQQVRNERKIALDYTRGGRKESVNIEIR